jgi:hypothetical protein
MLPSTHHFLSRLLPTTPVAAVHLEHESLLPGPWPTRDRMADEWRVYLLKSGPMGLCSGLLKL